MGRKKGLIIFDLDGTLYKLRGGSYRNSSLRRFVLKNARDFIADKLKVSKKEAEGVLEKVQKKYGNEISIALEKEYGLDRYEYFNAVWDIPARKIVKKPKGLRGFLVLIQKQYKLVLVSDAPRIWINNVLKELGIKDLFKNRIFSGEGDRRKEFGDAYKEILKYFKAKPADCVAVGDQKKTDIFPAEKLGMKVVFVGYKDDLVKKINKII